MLSWGPWSYKTTPLLPTAAHFQDLKPEKIMRSKSDPSQNHLPKKPKSSLEMKVCHLFSMILLRNVCQQKLMKFAGSMCLLAGQVNLQQLLKIWTRRKLPLFTPSGMKQTFSGLVLLVTHSAWSKPRLDMLSAKHASTLITIAVWKLAKIPPGSASFVRIANERIHIPNYFSQFVEIVVKLLIS